MSKFTEYLEKRIGDAIISLNSNDNVDKLNLSTEKFIVFETKRIFENSEIKLCDNEYHFGVTISDLPEIKYYRSANSDMGLGVLEDLARTPLWSYNRMMVEISDVLYIALKNDYEKFGDEYEKNNSDTELIAKSEAFAFLINKLETLEDLLLTIIKMRSLFKEYGRLSDIVNPPTHPRELQYALNSILIHSMIGLLFLDHTVREYYGLETTIPDISFFKEKWKEVRDVAMSSGISGSSLLSSTLSNSLHYFINTTNRIIKGTSLMYVEKLNLLISHNVNTSLNEERLKVIELNSEKISKVIEANLRSMKEVSEISAPSAPTIIDVSESVDSTLYDMSLEEKIHYFSEATDIKDEQKNLVVLFNQHKSKVMDHIYKQKRLNVETTNKNAKDSKDKVPVPTKADLIKELMEKAKSSSFKSLNEYVANTYASVVNMVAGFKEKGGSDEEIEEAVKETIKDGFETFGKKMNEIAYKNKMYRRDKKKEKFNTLIVNIARDIEIERSRGKNLITQDTKQNVLKELFILKKEIIKTQTKAKKMKDDDLSRELESLIDECDAVIAEVRDRDPRTDHRELKIKIEKSATDSLKQLNKGDDDED